MRSLQAQDKGLIFSTHDFDQGKAIARRLVAMERGKVKYDGPMSAAPLTSLQVGVRSRESGAGSSTERHQL